MKFAPVEMQRALILALHTGQRQSDLLRLPWSAYDGTTIRLQQSKTRMPVMIPCTAALRQMLDGMERVGPIILTSATGRPFKKRHFINCWIRAMEKAGLEGQGLHFQHLRGTFVTRMVESGAEVAEVAAITGHCVYRELRPY
jgi:integrase